MKKLFTALLFISISFLSNANEIEDNIAEFAAGLIPGEGHTEVSIDLRQHVGPDFSILAVREIAPLDDGNIFTQFSLLSTEKADDERIVGNLGLGSRKLLNNNTIMVGINNFYDLDFGEEHARTSLGVEARSAVLEFYANRYVGLADGYNEEHVLDGWDYSIASQIPFLHWAKAFMNSYEWEGVNRSDVRGTKSGAEMRLTSNLNLTVAHDDKKTTDDEWYSKLEFIHPGKEGPTMLDGASDTIWNEEKDMSGELLSKVNRHNRIMVEFKAGATISRTD